MNNKLEQAQDKFISYLGRLCNSFGINTFVAQLYAVLFLNGEEPLSLDEIVSRLKVSKGNVSINIRVLENWGMVQKVWVKGSRKDYYAANPDIEKVFVSKVRDSLRKRINNFDAMLHEFKDILDSGENDFTQDEKKLIRVYRERLKKVERMKNKADKLLKVSETILKFS